MYKTFLSWRYMRARRTNWIGVVGICVGVGALIMILSIMTGFLEETKKSLRGGLSDILIEAVQMKNRRGAPSDPAPLLAEVRADPRVAGACAQMNWVGMLSRGGREAGKTSEILASVNASSISFVHVVGVDVEDEFTTTEFRRALEQASRAGDGSDLGGASLRVHDVEKPFAPPPGYVPDGRPLASCVVGAQLARNWRLQRGSIIWISTAVPDEASGEMRPSDRQFVVAGAFRSGENEMDMQRIYVDRGELADFLSSGREYNQVLVKLHDYDKDGVATRDDLGRRLAGKGLIGFEENVRTWEDFRRGLLAAIENERVLMAIMLSLVVLVAAFTIFAILSMMVTEKRRDIGILTALGATPRGITWLFVLIGFWDTLLGATMGAILGTWAALKIDAIEQFLSKLLGVQIFDRNAYLFDHIPAIVNPLWVAVIVLGAFVIALLFALIPAWKAGRLHPLDALRYE